MGAQYLEDFISEPMGARASLANVMKHIAKVFPSHSPLRPVDEGLLMWMNNKHMLQTLNTIVSR